FEGPARLRPAVDLDSPVVGGDGGDLSSVQPRGAGKVQARLGRHEGDPIAGGLELSEPSGPDEYDISAPHHHALLGTGPVKIVGGDRLVRAQRLDSAQPGDVEEDAAPGDAPPLV